MRTGRLALGAWIATASLLLAACGARDPIVSPSALTPSGNWRVETQVDRITGVAIASAYLTTRKSSHTGVAFPQPALLNLTCFKDQPIARFMFQFKVGSTRNAMLGYRFDEKPGRDSVKVRFVEDYMTVVIEDKTEVAQFLKELGTSSSLYVLIRSLNAGRTSAEFQ